MKRIDVAVGIVYNQQGKILAGQRTVKDQYYQKWEFPGGKLEQGETPEQALKREFAEEVGIQITNSQELMCHEHNYPDRQVRLYIHTIKHYTGTVTPLEGQALKWVSLKELDELDFLQGNQAIIDKLKELV